MITARIKLDDLVAKGLRRLEQDVESCVKILVEPA